MNYITEIKAFYDLVSVKRLSTGQIVLWHALMYINNKCAWAEWFTVPNKTLELYTGLSRQSIVNARNVLKQYGALDFKANGVKATAYTLKILQVSLQPALQLPLQDALQPALRSPLPLNKQDETRLNKTFKEKIPAESKRKSFVKPSVEEIGAYCLERKNDVDPQRFYDFYEARGWMVGKVHMKDWKAAIRTWEKPKEKKAVQSSTSQLEGLDEAYRSYLEKHREEPFSERLTMSEFYEEWVNGHA